MSEKGLYEKYVVFKEERLPEGWEKHMPHPEVGAFVLKPDSDLAALHALQHYARATENNELAEDLQEWIDQIVKKKKEEEP